MKYFSILFLATLMLWSCSDDDDDYNEHEYHLELIGVNTVELPDEFIYGEIYTIKGTIELPNSCYYYYNQYEYFYEGDTRIIYPIAHVDDDITCSEVTSTANFSIPLHVQQAETYVFKFYQGVDGNGEEQFLTISVPVAN